MYSRVYVEITNICNGSCSFCPGTRRPPRSLTVEEFALLCQKLQGLTRYLYYHVMGEPLLHPQLPQLLALAGELGFHSAITTNGSLLPQQGEELLRAGLYKVHISVHSFEEGSREAQLAYLEGCIDFARRASQAGVLVVLRLWNRGFDRGRNIDTLALLRRHFPEPWQENPRGIRIRRGLFLEFGERFDWPDLQAGDLGREVFCYGLRDHFGILCDGTVVPCCLDREGAIALGNAFTDDLQALLQSPRARAMVEGFSCRRATEELCRRCGYARRFAK